MSEQAEVYSLSSFLEAEFVHFPLLDGDLLDSGEKMVMFGESESGKSYLALQLGLCLASQQPFLGYAVLKQCRTLIIQSELSARRYQERCQKLARGYPDNIPLFIWTVEDLKVDEPENRDRLLEVIKQIEPDVVIVDPLRAFFSGDENNSQAVELLFNSLATLQAALPVPFTIVYVHHVRKSASGFSKTTKKDDARGTGLIIDRPSTVLALEVNDKQTEWKLTTVKARNRDKHPPAMLLGIEEDTGLFVTTQVLESAPDYTWLTDFIGDEGKEQVTVCKWLMTTRKISQGEAYRVVDKGIAAGVVWKVKLAGSIKRMLYTSDPDVEVE